jgi:predicted nuclease with RNAse H fold
MNESTSKKYENILLVSRCVIGIDLTGSEKKASGWASLKEGHAVTQRILTDSELISETLKLDPVLISLDSPLSLPKGRISVYDDDPGRNIYGINRECERMMGKRGIRSYPPLIRSMQKLTLRGMLLAKAFRALGIEVIESFPGGAQDILGYARKQKDLIALINALSELGVQGSFQSAKVSHDEIDALTSALLGCFYLCGQYDALGNPDEGYLILPRLP